MQETTMPDRLLSASGSQNADLPLLLQMGLLGAVRWSRFEFSPVANFGNNDSRLWFSKMQIYRFYSAVRWSRFGNWQFSPVRANFGNNDFTSIRTHCGDRIILLGRQNSEQIVKILSKSCDLTVWNGKM